MGHSGDWKTVPKGNYDMNECNYLVSAITPRIHVISLRYFITDDVLVQNLKGDILGVRGGEPRERSANPATEGDAPHPTS